MGPVLGRLQETAHIADVVEAAGRGMSSVLVIRGEPGIGKSELLRFAAARARTGGAMVLSARGVERETSIPFAVLQELFRNHETTLAEIPEPRAAALAGALALRGSAPSDRFAVAAATLSLLGALAGSGSLLVAIDDLQWADAASVDALAFAAHRLGREGIALIATALTDEATGFDGSGFPELVLEGLDRASCLELIAREKPTVAPKVAERLITATGGNPLALGELLRTLDDDQLVGRRALDEPIRAGKAIEEAFARRLEQLSPLGRQALAVAAASSSRNLGVIVAALVDLGLGEAALDEGERARIVSWRDGILSFRHPLLRAAAYHTAAAGDRRAAHRALAAHEQPISAALHLADASFPPDQELAETLEAAAREARGRSGYASAGELFERAAIFSVDPGDRARRLFESGRAFEVAGDLERAGSVLDQARAIADDPLLRTEIEHVRGRAALWRGELGLARDVLAPEALRVASFSPTSALPILADALAALVLAGEIRAAEALAAEALEQIRGITTELTALSGGVSGQLTVLAGDAGAADAIARLDRLHGDGSARSRGDLGAVCDRIPRTGVCLARAVRPWARDRRGHDRARRHGGCGGPTSVDPCRARRPRAARRTVARGACCARRVDRAGHPHGNRVSARNDFARAARCRPGARRRCTRWCRGGARLRAFVRRSSRRSRGACRSRLAPARLRVARRSRP